ncbi:hypothetical protein SprV_0702273800 [Sparganum proliferum]
MKRKYFGVNRNTAYKRIRRLKRAYYAATESVQHVTVPTASTLPSDSPELEMPELTAEVSTAAIREHTAFSNCTVDTIRKGTIDWFHGARDRYGGRSKRRDNTTVNTTLPVSDNAAEQYPLHSPSEDTTGTLQIGGSGTPFYMSDNLVGKLVEELQKLTLPTTSESPPAKGIHEGNFDRWASRMEDYLRGIDASDHGSSILA